MVFRISTGKEHVGNTNGNYLMSCKKYWQQKLAALFAFAALIAACGGDPEPATILECGPGTVVADGQCVPASSDPCDDDQVLSIHGDCLDPDLYCGEHTVYDTELHECIATGDISCGEGTVESEGRCVVEDPLVCGEGTVLADGQCLLSDTLCGPNTEMENTQCEPTDGACQQGTEWDVLLGECVHPGGAECGDQTVEVDGQCIPQLTYADELAAQADLDHGDDVPITIDDDQPVVFTGTMDESLEHSFVIEGTEGVWLEITVYPRGLPSPGFSLAGPGGWERNVPAGRSNAPSRTVLLPADSLYELTVNTTLSDHPDAQSFADESWQYVGVVETVDTPTPEDWSPLQEDLSGDLRDTKSNFYRVQLAELDQALVTADLLGVDVEGASLEVWTSATSFAERYELVEGQNLFFELGSGSVVYLHIDAVQFVGPRADFELSARTSQTLGAGEFYTQEITAEKGDMIFLEHRNDDAAAVAGRVFVEGLEVYENDDLLANNRSSYSATQSKRGFFYVPEDGQYLLEFENTSSNDLDGFISVSSVGQVPVFDVPLDGDDEFAHYFDETLQHGDWRVVVINTPGLGLFDVDITSATSSIRASIFDAFQGEYDDDAGFGSAALHLEATRAGAYIVAVRPRYSSSNPQGIDIQIAGGTVDALEEGQIHEETFVAETFDLLTAAVSYATGDGPTLRLLNPDGIVIYEQENVADGATMAELIPGPGEFTVQVEHSGGEANMGFELDANLAATVDNLDIDDAVIQDYELAAHSENQRSALLFRLSTDLVPSATATADLDEELALRLWNVDDGRLLRHNQDTEEVVIASAGLTAGTVYAIEVESLSEMTDPLSLHFAAQEPHYIDLFTEFDPPEDLETGGEPQYYDKTVGNCPITVGISVSIDVDSSLTSYVDIDLYAPSITDAVRLRDGSGPLATVYPDETEPAEPLDPFLGISGNGTWTLAATNTASFTSATLNSWGLQLICVDG